MPLKVTPVRELQSVLSDPSLQDAKLQKSVSLFFSRPLQDYLQWQKDIAPLLQTPEGCDRMRKTFFKKTNAIIRKGETAIAAVPSPLIKKRVKGVFRSLISPFLLKGKLITRGFLKPRGYPGDYKTLEGMYDLQPWTEKGIGRLWDTYMLHDEYVESVRRRKEYMKGIVKEFIERNGDRELNLLNLGSGSSREIRELFSGDIKAGKKVTFNLVDQDGESLKYVKSRIDKIGHPLLHCNYIQENLVYFVRKIRNYRKSLGPQDLIYSIGVADYLPDLLCSNLFRDSFSLLRKNGLFVVAYKLVKEYKSYNSDWCCNWNFYERGEREITALIRESLAKYQFRFRYKKRSDDRIIFYGIEKLS